MITQELKQLIDQLSQRFDQLALLHGEIGTTSTKQQDDTDQLCQAVLNLTDKHINTLTDERDALQQQCQHTYKSIAHLKRLMGEYIDDTSQEQPSQPYSVTLEKLDAEKEIVQKHYEKRLADVKELHQQLIEYQSTLEDFVNTELIMQKDVDVSLPTVTALEEEIRRCGNEYVKRAQQVDNGTDQIIQLWQSLGLSPQSEFEHELNQLHDLQRQPDKKVFLYTRLVQEKQLNRIMQTIAQLDEIKQQREFRKQEIAQHLYRLWDRLQIDPDERNSFLQSNAGITSMDIQEYENELDRMLKLKSEKVQDFILDARNEMESLWNQLYWSKQERDAFTAFESDDYNDTLLEAHEAEIERLKHMVEDRKYILDKVERHMKLLQEVQDFEASTNDPKRLFGKGQRDPGRLLREEKFRKRISRELPKSKRDLEGSLREFQTSTGTPFTVYGESYLDKLTADDKDTSSYNDDHIPTTPKRPKTVSRPPMTSPRHRSHPKMHFHTPQANRFNNFQETFTETKNEWRRLDSQVSSTATILHRVRQNNIRKRERTRLPKPNNNKTPTMTFGKNKITKDIMSEDGKQRRQSDSTASSIYSTSSSGNSTLVEKDYHKNENVAPLHHTPQSPVLKQKRRVARTLSERRALLFDEDDMTLDLGIFDDGPELSDMSENDT